MAENETQEQQEQQEGNEGGGSGARTAVKAAAAAAATGAAAVAVRKVLSGSNGKSHLTSKNGEGSSKSDGGPGSLITSIASGGWDAARDALVPLAEDAAGAAGSYLAKNGPEFVRETLVPRFIESFNEARGD